MKKLNYSIQINASRETVWNTLWDDKTYRQWTSAFGENSHAESDWKQGSKILFLGNSDSGMVSKIAEKRAPEFMSFEHMGELKNGVEDMQTAKDKGWAGSHENYTLRENNDGTEVLVETDTAEEYVEMFSEMWPKALYLLKNIAEGK